MNMFHRVGHQVPDAATRWLYVLIVCTLTSCVRTPVVGTAQHSTQLPADRLVLANQMKDLRGEHIHMPPIPIAYSADRYINTTAEALRDSLKGKIVLIEIWDYTCVNCIRTLPYIKQWNDKYKSQGLVILGVHSPEFAFEKDPRNLDSAVKAFGLSYPVIADNDFQIWQSLANQYWPAKYLFDQNGMLRAEHFGEGNYEAFEAFLQKILLERDSTMALPELTKPVRETDIPGAVCYRPTPETYIGSSRSHIGNIGGEKANETFGYTLPSQLENDRLYLEGSWEVQREYARPKGGEESHLWINYQAKEVNLVIHPLDTTGFMVRVEQDGKPLNKADWGRDIVEENGETYLKIENPRMYTIVNNTGFARHTLRLSCSSASFGAYAFTFTTACQTQ